MLPLLLLGAGVWAWHRHSKVHTKPGLLTPAAAHLHGELMVSEMNPLKLENAAGAFKRNGLFDQAKQLKYKASQIRLQAKGTPDLVHCARTGDQNAIGMIAAIRERAAKGDPRAIVSANLIAKYCEKFPPPSLGPLGEVLIPPS